VVAIGAAHTGEPFVQIAAFEIIANHIIDNRAPKTVAFAKLLLVIPLECLVMRIEQLPQRRLLRLTRVVNGHTIPRQYPPYRA
jgi:hypothetical protein